MIQQRDNDTISSAQRKTVLIDTRIRVSMNMITVEDLKVRTIYFVTSASQMEITISVGLYTGYCLKQVWLKLFPPSYYEQISLRQNH